MWNDDIRAVITLSGSKRIPHLEEEIFANDELTEFYVCTLVADMQLFVYKGRNIIVDDIIFDYSTKVMGERWPAAEHLLRELGGGFWWKHYAEEFNLTPSTVVTLHDQRR